MLAASALAAGWTIALRSGSTGEARSSSLPAAPTGVSSACGTGKTVKVSWTAVTHASTYTVYQSTTSASSGYSAAATGVTGTSWTSGTLSAATYWFEVSATVGTKWASPNSTATASRVISSSSCS